jgi:multidrug efflux pump subunit AcrA (membrane-fusion protein)
LEKSDLLSQLRIDRGAARVPRRRTRLYLAIAAGVLLLGGGLWFGVLRAQPPVVQTAVARAASQGTGAGSVLDASGYVTARRQATVSAKITGKVTEVLIEEGQRVREGAVLARLDDTEAQAQLGLTRAQLVAARSQLAEVRAQLVQAEQDHARQKEPRSRSRWRSSRSRSPRSSSTTR